jgi:transcriptional regulator GlxA family with amidase domain
MKYIHVSILLVEGATLNSIDTTRQLFLRVNDVLAYAGKKPRFIVELVARDHQVVLNNNLYTINANRLVGDVQHTDLVVIPLICGDTGAIINANLSYLPWLINKYKNGAEIATLCVGAYILAATGLLDGKNCTIHWASANDFRKRFPKVNLLDNRIITDQNGIYTSGGNFSYLNLILYLIEKYIDRETSVVVSKMFEIEIERNTQAPYVIFVGQKNHADQDVKKIQDCIEQNYSDKITVELLCDQFAIARRSIERRFKKATGNTILEYVQRVRIEAAKRGIETSRKAVNDIMYDVGFFDAKAFRQLFKKLTGLTPVAYRAKYCKEWIV